VKEPVFLTLAEIIEIHKDQVERYGGDSGIRDLGLLQSALAQPEASFAGEWLHKDLFEMASAYAYHLCQNHPFIDGNKRVALATALVFLELNGVTVKDPKGKLLDAMLKMATGELKKPGFAEILRGLRS
jgi:death-on-curing protein